MKGTIVESISETGQSVLTASVGPHDGKGSMKRLHVLIVEDHDPSRYCLEGFLQKDGYWVRSFPCGEEAVEHLGVDRFDVLLTDLHLPGMDGFELITRAKAAQPSIRTLVMTAAATEEVRRRARIEKVDALFEKPIELDRLVAFVDLLPPFESFEDEKSQGQEYLPL